MAVATTPKRSLVEFAKDKRRKDCVVCKLPEQIRQELAIARDKKIDRRTVLEWLETDCGVKIADADLTTHRNGHHEER